MIITTTDNVGGYKVKQYLGVVTVTNRDMLNDFDYGKILEHFKNQVQGAADAIVGVRFVQAATNIVRQGLRLETEYYMVAYGTAVKLEKE